jgi:Tol biopolymer transport system component
LEALTAAAGVLVAVGMLLIMVALVEPAEAAFPGQNGKIVFTSHRDGNPEIYTMNILNRLTRSSAGDHAPAWSPDGNRIVFTSNRDGNDEIYAMNSDGSGSVDRLTNNVAIDYGPDWQPL